MAAPTVTYTFTNGTTADGTQVSQNFTDIINSITDGSKDLSISALTLAGAFTANGACTFGNASSDDITVNGSIASSIPIKTTFTYDLGAAAIGIKDLYFGSDNSAAFTTKIRAGTVGANKTFILPEIDWTNPTADGNAYDSLVTSGSGVMSFIPSQGIADMYNVGLSVGMAANAATITLTQADGSTAPSSASPVIICFRSSTLTTGAVVRRACTSSINTVISSGSTAGQADGATYAIYIYALDNAGTIELAWSRLYFKNENELVSTTAEGGAGAADAAGTMYSTAARNNVPFRLIGRFVSTQATAGTWVTAATEVTVGNKATIEYEPIVARYDTDAGQSIPHNSETIVDFDSTTFGYDPFNCVTTGAAWKFTSLRNAYYSVKAHIRYASVAWVANEYNYLTLYRDAGAVAYLQQDKCTVNVTQEKTAKGSTSIYIAKDSYIDVRAYQYTGGALALTASEESNYISIEEIN